MIPGRSYTSDYFLHLAWFRKWLILLPFALIGATTVVVSDRLPNRYRSETLILVIPQRVPEEYVRSTVTGLIDDRLRTISQQILSRTRLEQVIEEMGIYPEELEELPMQDVVEGMRSQISIDIVQGNDPVSSFRLSYEADDPVSAMTVLERLAEMFITENLREREVLATGTSTFLEGQLESARQELIVHEQRLEEYRRRHAGQLPSELATNLQVIQSLQFQLQSVSDSINRDRNRLYLVERSIADVPSRQALATVDPVLAPAAVRLQTARNALQSLELRFSQTHPDIVKMKRLIGDLEEEVSQEGGPEEESDTADDTTVTRALDVATWSRLRELEAERELLERQILYRSDEQRRLQDQMNTYQTRVEAVPARESELVELNRDYTTLRSIYETLLAKREESRIAENLERRQIGEQFRVLDPASLPESPISPDRLRINLGGAAGGLFLGLALVVLLEYRDQTLRTETDASIALSVPVLTVLPALPSASEFRRTKRKTLAISTVSVLTIVACCGVAVWTLF